MPSVQDVTAPAASAVPLTGGAYKYYVLAAMTVVSFLNYMDRMVLAVLVEPIKRDLHLSDTQIGLLSGFAFALLYAVLGIPLARLADRRSRTVILSACVAVWSAMTAACGLAAGFAHLFMARVGVGVGEAGCVPSSHSLLGDYFPAERRAFAISIFQAGGLAGLSMGLMATGFLADTFGWRMAFLIVGAPGMLLGAVILLTIREPRGRRLHGREPAADEQSMLSALRVLGARPAFVNLVIALTVGAFATYGMAQWLAAFFIRVHGLSLTQIGLWSGLSSGVGSISGVLVGGAVAVPLIRRDRRWELWVPALSYGLGCPLYLAVFLWPDPWVAIGIKFFASMVVGSGGGVALAALQSVAEPRLRATAIAIMMFVSAFIGMGAGPFAVGAISDFLAPTAGVQSLRYALVGVTFVLLLASLFYTLASRTIRQDAIN